MMRLYIFFIFSVFSILQINSGECAKKTARNPDRKCLSDLRRARVGYILGPWHKGIKTPVTIPSGKIGKIQLMNGSKKARPVMDCRLALALYRVGPIFSVNGDIDRLSVGKVYSRRFVKNTSRLSHHSYGLAIDIYGIHTRDGKTYDVTSDYRRGTSTDKICAGPTKRRGARLLRQLACDLDASHYFAAILTPDADREHRDHFHIHVFGGFEKKNRKHRTSLVEPQNYRKRWVLSMGARYRPSISRVWQVVRSRRRANSRLIRSRKKKRLSR
ncbi:MAG: extensin family protein [Deltaproteobacteria bacterium]|nr:extensin family protein [Deltaproteobacteria bacterium]